MGRLKIMWCGKVFRCGARAGYTGGALRYDSAATSGEGEPFPKIGRGRHIDIPCS